MKAYGRRAAVRQYLTYDAEGAFLGGTPIMEQAVGAAKRIAAKCGKPVDVVRICDRTGSRRCRYHPDGSVERLWEKEAKEIG